MTFDHRVLYVIMWDIYQLFRWSQYDVRRRLQDHQSVERGDAAVAAHVPAQVGRLRSGMRHSIAGKHRVAGIAAATFAGRAFQLS